MLEEDDEDEGLMRNLIFIAEAAGGPEERRCVVAGDATMSSVPRTTVGRVPDGLTRCRLVLRVDELVLIVFFLVLVFHLALSIFILILPFLLFYLLIRLFFPLGVEIVHVDLVSLLGCAGRRFGRFGVYDAS